MSITPNTGALRQLGSAVRSFTNIANMQGIGELQQLSKSAAGALDIAVATGGGLPKASLLRLNAAFDAATMWSKLPTTAGVDVASVKSLAQRFASDTNAALKYLKAPNATDIGILI